jgi:D-sedoheptulose 7-phosphate isomerase
MANDLAVRGGTNGPSGVRALSLVDALPALTAVANDSGYERVFVAQLEVHFRPGDMLLAISASGNSANVVAAARWVRAQGGRVLALTGFDGGELRRIADVTVHVDTPHGEYGPVEDVHLVLDHLATMWLAASARAAVTE